MNGRNLVYFLSIAVLVANIGDMLTTLRCLSIGATELNPLYTILGTNFFLFKAVYPTAIVIAVNYLSERFNNRSFNLNLSVFLATITAIFIFCIINNLEIIFNV